MPTRNLRRQCRSKFLHGINHNAPEKTYSQEGEDIILKRYFENRKNGFYVVIGAHHPYRYSNTALLREMGWSGINIEPSPDLIEKFYHKIKIPLTFVGGANSIEEIKNINSKYKYLGLGVGSFFIYKGKNKAILISYPEDITNKN